MPSFEEKIARRLADEPLCIPGRLATMLAKDEGLYKRLLRINPRALRDVAVVDDLDHDIKGFLERSGKTRLYADWETSGSRLREFVEFGSSGRVEAIVAMILAGAAISRRDINPNHLRAGLDRSLLEECVRYRNATPPGMPHPYVQSYDALKIGGGKPLLHGRIKDILTDHGKVKSLRLGKALSTLALDQIEAHRAKYFLAPITHSSAGIRTGQLLTDRSVAVPQLTAPQSVSLELTSAQCDQQQENGDLIFWLSYFTKVKDLPGLYQQIDRAIASGSLSGVALEFESLTVVRKTDKYPFVTNQSKTIGMSLGEVGLVQGFGPWHCHLGCYEDDNDEYEAVGEVFDQIGDYAGYVQQGAEIVTLVSGPTVVAAGAAVVASVAETVKVCAEVGSAIVSIANLLDENDSIGSAPFDGEGDYLRAEPGFNEFPTSDIGLYSMNITEKRWGEVAVTRHWEIQTVKGYGEKITSESGAIPGISEDYNFEFKMNAQTDYLLTEFCTVDHHCVDEGWDGSRGWWKFNVDPVLSANDHVTVVGEFHVGLAGYGKVEDTPMAQGIRVVGAL